MKIEKLNENKIKITLNKEDLRKRNIDIQSFIYNSPETQDLFWDVMKEAEKELGFSVEESMVYVEASASASGIFTLVVTKTANNSLSNLKNRLKKKNYKLKCKSTLPSLDNSVYRFDTFDDLLDFCNVIKPKDIGPNSLYSYNGNYYLLITKISNSHILEYATKEYQTEVLLSQMSEYGECFISTNAVETLQKHFFKSKKVINKENI